LVRELLFGCLFGSSGSSGSGEVNKTTEVDLSKCKTRGSRKWAFQVLSHLTKGSLQNFEEVVHFISSRHLNRPARTNWDVQQEQFEKTTKFVGIRNLGATCYMVFFCLFFYFVLFPFFYLFILFFYFISIFVLSSFYLFIHFFCFYFFILFLYYFFIFCLFVLFPFLSFYPFFCFYF
jgi:hypothetical protein